MEQLVADSHYVLFWLKHDLLRKELDRIFDKEEAVYHATVVKVYENKLVDGSYTASQSDELDDSIYGYFDSLEEAELKLAIKGWKMTETHSYDNGKYMGQDIVKAFILTKLVL